MVVALVYASIWLLEWLGVGASAFTVGVVLAVFGLLQDSCLILDYFLCSSVLKCQKRYYTIVIVITIQYHMIKEKLYYC